MATGKPVIVEIDETGTALEPYYGPEKSLLQTWITEGESDPSSDAPFGFLYAYRYGQQDRAYWQGFWDQAVEKWLSSGRRRSPHTRRSYRHALMSFKSFMLEHYGIIHLWQVTDTHVNAWITWMGTDGKLGKRTIGQRLAALSSYYDYCASTTAMMHGREITLFIDSWGSTRLNPFLSRNIERPKVTQFSGATAVPKDAYNWIISDLRDKVAARPWNIDAHRNLALMLMFGFNGWRNEEVIAMTWGKLAESSEHKGQYTYRWTGKARDGEEEKRAVPAVVVDAITAYLKADGRWAPGMPNHIATDDYIWRPLRTHGTANFVNVTKLSANRHISQSTVNGILQSLLRHYYAHVARQMGLSRAAARTFAAEKAANYSIHSLRHMFARQLYTATGNDLNRVSKKLGHKSLATTQTYMENLTEPVDDFSELLARQLGLEL